MCVIVGVSLSCMLIPCSASRVTDSIGAGACVAYVEGDDTWLLLVVPQDYILVSFLFVGPRVRLPVFVDCDLPFGHCCQLWPFSLGGSGCS